MAYNWDWRSLEGKHKNFTSKDRDSAILDSMNIQSKSFTLKAQRQAEGETKY